MTARGKGKEISLQVEIESQEDWEENLAKEGLIVIDVYQEWCGPCKSMVPIFKRIKNESGDDLLRFAIAKADTVEALDRYRGKCEPKFLFYAGGLLVDVIHGADAPALGRSIIIQLENEKKVAEGSANRKEIIDPKFPVSKRKIAKESVVSAFEDELSSIGSSDEEEMEQRRSDSHMRFGGENIVLSDIDGDAHDKVLIERECAVMIIYPDVLTDGKVKDIMIKLRTSKFDILDEVEKELTEDEIKDLLGDSEEYTEEFKTFMMTSPIYALIVTKGEFGERIFHLLQDIIGPKGVTMDTKDMSPNSLRANYLKGDSKFGGFYSSESVASFKKEISILFPNFVSKKVSLTNLHSRVEQITIMVIRPEALERLSAIMDTIATLDFKVVMKQEKLFTEIEVKQYFFGEYSDLDGAVHDQLLESMTKKPCLILVLTNGKDSVVDDLLVHIGPKDTAVAFAQAPNSFRSRFGQRDALISNFEVSMTIDQAEKEFFRYFPTEQATLLIKPDAFIRRDEIMTVLRKKDFFVSGRKDIHLERNQVEGWYHNKTEEPYYSELLEYMTCGPCCLMILSRYKALNELNLLIYGPNPDNINPYLPIEKEPTFRNFYGTDMMKNALKASRTSEEAQTMIKMFWGDVDFEDDGTMKKKKKVKRDTICEAKGKFTTKEDDNEQVVNDSDNQIQNNDEKNISHVASRSESKLSARSESKLSQQIILDASRSNSKNQELSRPQSKVSNKSFSTAEENKPTSDLSNESEIKDKSSEPKESQSINGDQNSIKSNKSAESKKEIAKQTITKKPPDAKKIVSNTTKTTDKKSVAVKQPVKKDTTKSVNLDKQDSVDKQLTTTVEKSTKENDDLEKVIDGNLSRPKSSKDTNTKIENSANDQNENKPESPVLNKNEIENVTEDPVKSLSSSKIDMTKDEYKVEEATESAFEQELQNDNNVTSSRSASVSESRNNSMRKSAKDDKLITTGDISTNENNVDTAEDVKEQEAKKTDEIGRKLS